MLQSNTNRMTEGTILDQAVEMLNYLISFNELSLDDAALAVERRYPVPKQVVINEYLASDQDHCWWSDYQLSL